MSINLSDHHKYLNPLTASKINNLELRARLVVEGFKIGIHTSPYHGFSAEFSQHRPYMQGDNLKDVDWKVLGKTEKYFIKQYEEETNLRCQIVLDTSNSMRYQSDKNISKIEYAKTLAAAISYLLIKQQDAVGLSLYSDKLLKYLPPKSTNAYLNEILKNLASVQPESTTNSSLALKSVAEKLNKRGLVVIISDFFDELESTLNALKHFAYKKNDVIVFQILDPMERNFAFQKDSIFKDLETGDEITTQPYQIQKAYKESMLEFTNSIKRECLNSNFDYHLIDTSINFDKALYSFIQKRSRLN